MSLSTAYSSHDVRATTALLLEALDRREIELFATIDHAAGARRAGLELPDEVLIIFGDPKVGTLLMQEDARIGYELPLRILLRAQDDHTVAAFRPPTELAEEYGVSGHATVLQRMTGLLEEILAEITSS